MIRTLRTLMLAGLGTLDLTEERLRAAFGDLVERGEVTEKDARDLVAPAFAALAQMRTDIHCFVLKLLDAVNACLVQEHG